MEEGVAGRDLVPLDAANVSKVHNGFAEILRHHHISDRQGAFDTLLSLCLCKCVDEADGGDEAPAFRAPVGEPADALLARLLTLYRRGMRRYFDEEVIAGVHALAFRRIDTAAHLARNAEVLAEVVRLLAPYRLTGSREPVLGNLFELLLNDGLKQAVGQFFTPTPVAALAVAALPIDGIVRARQAEGHRSPVPRIIDPACGSGHFLTEAARALAALPGVDALPAHTLVGIERDDRLARAARIGALMHGVPVIDIRCGEGLDHPAALGPPGDFDVVLANPPYSIKGFRRYLQLANNRLELLEHVTDAGAEIEAVFVERAAQLLRPGGVAALVLPTSILANPSRIGGAVRRLLLSDFRWVALVELPGGTFAATSSPAVLLFLERRARTVPLAPGAAESVLVVRPESGRSGARAFLGYGWSQRRGAEGLHRTGPGLLQPLAAMIRAAWDGDGGAPAPIPHELASITSCVSLDEMVDRSGTHLRISATPRVGLRTSSRFPAVPFSELVRLRYGKALTTAQREGGPYPVMGSNGPVGAHSQPLVRGPTVVVGRKGSAGVVRYCPEDCWPIDTTFYVEVVDDAISPEFAYWLLRWVDLRRLVGLRGTGVPGLNRNDVLASTLPRVPVVEQRAILDAIHRVDDRLRDADEQRMATLDRHLG